MSGARMDIWSLVRDASSAGCAVMAVSSDMEELSSRTCDRVIVLRSGEVVAEVAGDELTAEILDQLTLEVHA